MSALTEVELYFVKGKIERWIRFGTPIRRSDNRPPPAHRRPSRRAPFLASCAGPRMSTGPEFPASTFCAPARTESPFDGAGRQAGRGNSAAGLRLGKGSARAQSDRGRRRRSASRPQEVCPDHWRHVHSRLAAGLTPSAYSRERHRAWLLRSGIAADDKNPLPDAHFFRRRWPRPSSRISSGPGLERLASVPIGLYAVHPIGALAVTDLVVARPPSRWRTGSTSGATSRKARR